jgi:hypothetical protein
MVVIVVQGEFDDQNNPFYIALLDAKSAFDVVVLKILMRKAYLFGIDLSTWLIIDKLHRNTRSVVKWDLFVLVMVLIIKSVSNQISQ